MVKLNEGASSLAMHFKLCIPTLFSSNRPQHLRLSSMYSGVLDKSTRFAVWKLDTNHIEKSNEKVVRKWIITICCNNLWLLILWQVVIGDENLAVGRADDARPGVAEGLLDLRRLRREEGGHELEARRAAGA